MDHVAYMNRSWKLIDAIIEGKKTIETRWYKNRTIPWGRIHQGDEIYFKESGGLVRAQAKIARVEYYAQLNADSALNLFDEKWKNIAVTEDIARIVREKAKNATYAIFIYLEDAREIEPFDIDKNGFGAQSAWLVCNSIADIKR